MKRIKTAREVFGAALRYSLIAAVLGFPISAGAYPDVAFAASLADSSRPNQSYAAANVTATSFRFPLDNDWSITLGFGDTTELGTHLGEDVYQPEGTEVYAAADGIVKFAGHASGYGDAVVIEHCTGSEYVCTFYSHLSSRLGLEVSPDEEVSGGQLIGYIAYDDEDGGDWSPHIHFGIRKGPHQSGWVYHDYDPPGDIADWYNPSRFIETYEGRPQDRSLVSPAEGEYQDRVYWLQNGKLYWVTEFIDGDSEKGSTIDGMSSLPGWEEDKISEFWPGLLSSYIGWPAGMAKFITTGSKSNGLLLRKIGSDDIYLIHGGRRVWFPDAAAVEYAGYSLADVIDVSDGILALLDRVTDSAAQIESSGDVIVAPGQSFSIWIETKNTGTSVWREELQYRLGWRSGFEQFTDSEIIHRIALASSEDVTPGIAKRWSVRGITAPSAPGDYFIVWQMVREDVYWFGDTANIRVMVRELNDPPHVPSAPSGTGVGYTKNSYTYSTSALDPDGDELQYTFDWGDGTISKTDYIGSGVSASLSHSWGKPGTYRIRVKAADRGGASSDWSIAKMVVFNVLPPSAPSPPTLLFPADDAIVPGTLVTFEWKTSAGVNKYFLEVNTTSSWDETKRKFYGTVDGTSKTMADIYLLTNGVKRWFPDKAAVESAGYSMADVVADFPGDGTTYYWRMRARNVAGWGAWSTTMSFVNMSEPSAPTLNSPADKAEVSGTSVTFEWQALEEANNYLLEVNTAPDWGRDTRMFYGEVGNVTQYQDTAYLNDSTTYYWRVRAGNGAGWSTPSVTRSFISVTPILSSPTEGAKVAGASVIFQWQTSEGVDKYLLEVNTDSKWDEDDRRFYGVVGNVAEYEDTDYPNDGTTYYWRVWAHSDAGWVFRSTSWSFVNTSVEKPSTPTLSSPDKEKDGAKVKVSGASVTFKWVVSARADKYFLEVNTDPKWGKEKRKFLGNVGDVTEFKDKGYPSNGTTYYWRVRAGNASGWSDWSESRSFFNTTEVLAPALSFPEDGDKASGTSITFKWTAPEGAQKYLLEVVRTPPPVLISGSFEVDEESVWEKGTTRYRGNVGKVVTKKVAGFPDDGTTYYWRVRAGGKRGWSSWSETWSFINGNFDNLSAPILSSPADGARVTGTSVTFKWKAVQGACNYQLEVNSSRFWDKRTRQYRLTVGNVGIKKVTDFPNDGSRYYWRVRARNAAGWSDWSESQTFVNGPP